jgi:hypothetical protein
MIHTQTQQMFYTVWAKEMKAGIFPIKISMEPLKIYFCIFNPDDFDCLSNLTSPVSSPPRLILIDKEDCHLNGTHNRTKPCLLFMIFLLDFLRIEFGQTALPALVFS